MDYSLVGIAASSISMAKELAKTAIGLRDFNQVSAVVSQLNDQLLKAQDALFTHNAQMLTLQQQHFEATQKLREMEEAIAERGRYSLFELIPGFFVYRMNITPVAGHVSDPGTSEVLHYLCQICLDRDGFKSVLRFAGGRCICGACSRGVIVDQSEVDRLHAITMRSISR